MKEIQNLRRAAGTSTEGEPVEGGAVLFVTVFVTARPLLCLPGTCSGAHYRVYAFKDNLFLQRTINHPLPQCMLA